MTEVYRFLMNGELKPLYQLGLRSFEEHGFKNVLYTYNSNLKADCEIRDLNEMLPESEVFYYKNLGEQFKYGGITERIKAEMCHKLGGWQIDLDVTCLQPFELNQQYVFRPHKLGIVANIIKTQAYSDFTRYYLEWTKTIDENSADYENSIRGLYPACVFLNLKHFIVDERIFGRDEDEWYVPFLENNNYSPSNDRVLIHWCDAMGRGYEEGSYLDSLFKKYGL